MDIILDTNVIRNDLMLKSHRFKILLDFALKTGSSIVLPIIVLDELKSLFKRELIFRIRKFENAVNELAYLLPDSKILVSNFEVEIDKTVDNYEQFILNKLNIFHVEKIEYKDSYLKEIIKRSNERIKPFSQKGEEFRDAILWLSILDFLQKKNYTITIFITNNIKDFADESQLNLHPDLQYDLKKQNSNLQFYSSLDHFIREKAIKVNFITKEWLIDNLDWNRLNFEAVDAVNGINAVFFYDYYYRNKIDIEDLQRWEVFTARFEKGITNFFIYDPEESGSYELEIHLEGKSNICFTNDQNKHFYREVTLYTSIYLTVEDEHIFQYKGGYYEEETILEF